MKYALERTLSSALFHAFGCENGMFVCLSDGESSDDDDDFLDSERRSNHNVWWCNSPL